MKSQLKIALIGNPNCGKSTIFNYLTGRRQHVGNYPGVTVEKKEGELKFEDVNLTIVDLPGIYSMSPFSEEELIARNFIINEKPDVLINVIDASNLERSLFLTTQLMELDVHIVLALNMLDVASKNKIEIDTKWLEDILEIVVITTVGNKKTGLDKLLKTAVSIGKTGHISHGINVKFNPLIESAISQIEPALPDKLPSKNKRWLSLKLLEEDSTVIKILDEEVLKNAKKSIVHLDKNIEELLIKERHGFISNLCKKVLKNPNEHQRSFSDKIDSILTNRFWGIPIFFLIMYLVFQITFSIGFYPMKLLEMGFANLSNFIGSFWQSPENSLLYSLTVKGIIGGVGAVIIFLPNILLLFLCICILEESGYMARGAFIMDKLMHRIGLHGKSFIPMLIGFGCSVPAIMATRTLENKKDRIITILVLPLIACSAKLVVFTLFIPPFFSPRLQPIILLLLYILGLILAVGLIKVFKLTLFKEESFSFVMELPAYRLPTLKLISSHMWERGFEYVKKAGSFILAFSIILWALMAFPLNKEENKLSQSYLYKIGHLVEPAFKPLGFDWKIDTALLGSLAGKEVFIAQLGIGYSVKEGSSQAIQNELKKDYTPLQAFCIMLFILISSPCLATLVVTKKETKSWRWAFFQLFGLSFLAYILTFIVYKVGGLIL